MKLKLALFLIIIIASALRLWQLGSVPVSIYWDEASIGYNAFSIAQTFRDEHGVFLPTLFEAFGDYKMPGYIYSAALVIKLLGLNEFTTRLPSALFGIGTVIATFFLTRELLRHFEFSKIKEPISLLSAGLLAISPWHIQFSRAAYEANGGLFFVVLGLTFLMRAIRMGSYNYIISATFLGVSLYFYRSIHLFLPLLLLVIGVVFLKQILAKKNITWLIIASILFVVLAIPVIQQVYISDGSSRANDVLVFNNLDEKVSLFQMWAIQSGNGYLGNIFYNERVVYFNEIVSNYLSHFSPSFLFTSGDPNPRHSPRNMGVMYLWELPLLIYGGYILARSRGKAKYVIFGWLLLAPLPAALSIFAPHALRTLNLLPVPQILVAIGVIFLFQHLKSRVRIPVAAVGMTIALFWVSTYLFNYFTTSTFLTAKDWGDGYKQLNEYVQENHSKYESVIISGHYWQPYIYTLFYTQYDPKEYQENGTPYQFGKYKFGGTSWIKEGPSELGSVNLIDYSGAKNALVILSPEEYQEQTQPPGLISEIKDINNNVIYFVGQVQKTEY